ncbi:DUF397 domain-containing protein [Streptomyces sp. NPDC047070]|uniref:DUF397 domain-containing protein n=1 Tax=Streptomyces sp. NPDC047070 TaxID=3154923 RepID=UPI003451B923
MSTTELTWFKSSYSGDSSGDCVEVAVRPATTVHVRDSKNTRGPQLTLSPGAWGSFIQGVSGPRSTA